MLVSLAGPLNMEDLFRQITAAVRAARPGRVGHDLAQALDRLTDPGVAWAERLAVLQERVLAEVPLLLVLDNFEDNLAGEVGEPDHQVGEEFLAVFLATWVTRPHRARLLITSRFTFTLPDGADRFLSFRAIGPLSEAESKKLAWSLPALDGLTEGELTRACRLVGGHPRRLEYLDALLAGGRARYPDITARLESALRHLPAGTRPVDESPLKSAVAETTALIAGDVLLDELIARLAELPGATELLLAVSVYRKPVDISALAFQVGEPDSAAAEVPARRAAEAEIRRIADEAGLRRKQHIADNDLPEPVRASFDAAFAVLLERPPAPFRLPGDLSLRIAACQAVGLLFVEQKDASARYFVHRWTADALAVRADGDDRLRLTRAHRQAAAYWHWLRKAAPVAVNDEPRYMAEALYHLREIHASEEADQVALEICVRLDEQGAYDQEVTLINGAMKLLPEGSPRRGKWVYQLGVIQHQQGRPDEASLQYEQALEISRSQHDRALRTMCLYSLAILARERGDHPRAWQLIRRAWRASWRHHRLRAGIRLELGRVARARGRYREASRRLHRLEKTFERHGDRAGLVSVLQELAAMAADRTRYEEAGHYEQRALEISEQIGDQTGMSICYRDLGNLAYTRNDYDEAIRCYHRALDIDERLGNRAGIAGNSWQLGMIAQDLKDYDEAVRQFKRAHSIAEQMGDQDGLFNVLRGYGLLAYRQGKSEEAGEYFSRALTNAERRDDHEGIALMQANLGLNALARGNYAEALRLLLRFQQIERRLRIPSDASLYSLLGTLGVQEDRPPGEVIGWYVNALTIRLAKHQPDTESDLRGLAAYQAALGKKKFDRLLAKATRNSQLADEIKSLIDTIGDASQAAAAEPS